MSCIWLGDRLGRIRTIMIGAALNTVGSIFQASSFSLGQLIVGRIVSGLGFGALTATAPNWQSECSKAEHRGSVVILESLFISLGLGQSLFRYRICRGLMLTFGPKLSSPGSHLGYLTLVDLSLGGCLWHSQDYGLSLS